MGDDVADDGHVSTTRFASYARLREDVLSGPGTPAGDADQSGMHEAWFDGAIGAWSAMDDLLREQMVRYERVRQDLHPRDEMLEVLDEAMASVDAAQSALLDLVVCAIDPRVDGDVRGEPRLCAVIAETYGWCSTIAEDICDLAQEHVGDPGGCHVSLRSIAEYSALRVLAYLGPLYDVLEASRDDGEGRDGEYARLFASARRLRAEVAWLNRRLLTAARRRTR